MNQIPKILNFSATDPSGGAGMNADIMTQTSLGCHPLSVVTGVTVQDTNGVDYLSPIDAEIVNDQARKILKDSDIDVIKCGLLCSTENIVMLSQIIADYPKIPVILDPIISSGMGDQLSTQDMLESMIEPFISKDNIDYSEYQ
jgi:hydroxymethylpyrimidine/phosphomethylpyrimidine kinase